MQDVGNILTCTFAERSQLVCVLEERPLVLQLGTQEYKHRGSSY